MTCFDTVQTIIPRCVFAQAPTYISGIAQHNNKRNFDTAKVALSIHLHAPPRQFTPMQFLPQCNATRLYITVKWIMRRSDSPALSKWSVSFILRNLVQSATLLRMTCELQLTKSGYTLTPGSISIDVNNPVSLSSCNY